MQIPKEAQTIFDLLYQLEPESYFVGGCVRDSLLRRPVHDWDLTTKALPERVMEHFQAAGYQVIPTGLKHGTVTVVMDHIPFEITTFRSEGVYVDNRHPSAVEFCTTLEDDLSRRDFTVNALAMQPTATGMQITEDLHGEEDLRNRIIRCVGDPNERFQEDALRILRMLRFAVKLGFSIEEKTFEAAVRHRALLKKISAERIKTELDGFLMGDEQALPLYLDQRTMDILQEVIPELAVTYHYDQNTHWHEFDLWEHICRAMISCPQEPILRWTMLLHDLGKPAVRTEKENGESSYLRHAKVSEKMAEEILNRLRFSNHEKQEILFYVGHHDNHLAPARRLLMRKLSRYGMERTRNLGAVNCADKRGRGSSRMKNLERSKKLSSFWTSWSGKESVTASRS